MIVRFLRNNTKVITTLLVVAALIAVLTSGWRGGPGLGIVEEAVMLAAGPVLGAAGSAEGFAEGLYDFLLGWRGLREENRRLKEEIALLRRAAEQRREKEEAYDRLSALLDFRQAGFTPSDTLFDAPAVFLGADNLPTYSPRNHSRRYFGVVTLRRALEHSINVTAVKLMDLVGVQRVVDFARACGIESDLPPYPSLALGSADLSPLELAGAYAAVANQGIYVYPYMVESVAADDGRVLEQHRIQASKAMQPEIAYVLTHMLEGVIDRGTGKLASRLDVDLAGKTGTTNSYTDTWFVGFSPRYTVLVWIGYDVKRSIGRNMTGTAVALPVWTRIIERGLDEGWIIPGERFVAPPGVTYATVDYYTGLLPGSATESVIEEAFLEGTEPTRVLDPKQASISRLPWYQQEPFYVPKSGENMPAEIEDWALVREAWESKGT